MSFDYEHQMLIPAEKWLTSQGLITKKEFFTPWGMCDLVGCSLNDLSVKWRLLLGQKRAIGSHLRIMILSRMPDKEDGKSIYPKSLYREFSGVFDKKKIKHEIDRLIKDKFVQKTSKGAYQKLNGWIPLHKRIVALELKLSRISDVLHQAINNLEFADESYVGLPIKNARRVMDSPKKLEFQEKGIGILGIDSAKCKVFLPAISKKYEQNQTFQIYCAERFWRDKIKDIEA
jgi:hypothetical protein